MIKKRIINPGRIRRIEGGFSFIPHRFITGGFLQSLNRQELVLYFFLVLVLPEYLEARKGLIDKELICFENNIFQVLSLPRQPVMVGSGKEDPATVRHFIVQSLKEAGDA